MGRLLLRHRLAGERDLVLRLPDGLAEVRGVRRRLVRMESGPAQQSDRDRGTARHARRLAMGLTTGTGPFSSKPTGELNFAVAPPTGSALIWWPVPQRIRAVVGDETLVDSREAKLLHETGHLPVYYFPRHEVRFDLLEPSETRTYCPHKGEASYWTVVTGEQRIEDAAWTYREPLESAAFLAEHIALYWNRVDAWLAEDELLLGHPHDPFPRLVVNPTSRHV